MCLLRSSCPMEAFLSRTMGLPGSTSQRALHEAILVGASRPAVPSELLTSAARWNWSSCPHVAPRGGLLPWILRHRPVGERRPLAGISQRAATSCLPLRSPPQWEEAGVPRPPDGVPQLRGVRGGLWGRSIWNCRRGLWGHSGPCLWLGPSSPSSGAGRVALVLPAGGRQSFRQMVAVAQARANGARFGREAACFDCASQRLVHPFQVL